MTRPALRLAIIALCGVLLAAVPQACHKAEPELRGVASTSQGSDDGSGSSGSGGERPGTPPVEAVDLIDEVANDPAVTGDLTERYCGPEAELRYGTPGVMLSVTDEGEVRFADIDGNARAVWQSGNELPDGTLESPVLEVNGEAVAVSAARRIGPALYAVIDEAMQLHVLKTPAR